jgi:hypothetical protein
MRWGVRAAKAALVTMLATALVVELAGGPTQARPAEAPAARVTPVFHGEVFADPSVVPYAGGYLAISTGWKAPRAVSRSPRGPWHPVSRALPELPRWVRSPQIWASDLVRTRSGWLLYYSAVAQGKTRRCIGVASARTALDPFRPIGKRPLVCPRPGAIDPSGFTSRHGRRFLLFKTQGNPASIRLLPLTRDGRHRARHQHVRVLLRSKHTVENPVLVQHKRHLVLFTSEGYFGTCDYRTTWRRSRSLRHWGRAEPHTLLRRANTRVCGPGGADVLTAGRKHPVVYFHGWTCGHGRRPCPHRFLLGRTERPLARRVMYAAHLRWRHGKPRVHGFVRRH